MQRLGLISAGALFALSSATSVIADGVTPDRSGPRRAAAAPAQPATNWTGGQFGGHGGGSQLGQSFAEPGSNLCPAGVALSGGVSAEYPSCRETHFSFNSKPASATLGLLLGYSQQFGNMVAGVEGDASWKDASKSAASNHVTTVFQPDGVLTAHIRNETFTGKQSQGWDGSIRGRLGMLLTPTMLAYATGGLAIGEVCGAYSYYATLVGSTTATASGSAKWCDTRAGYTAGGGLEVQLMAGWKGRIEYRFTDFGDYSKNIPLSAAPGAPCSATFSCTGNARVDLNENVFHTVRVGIALDF